jgi:tetratricopeptide (TPR) repeat protein
VVLLSGVLSVLLSACGATAKGPQSVTPNQEALAVQNRQELVSRGREAMRRGDSIRAEHYFALALEQGYESAELLPELLAVCLSSSRLRSALNYAEPYLRKHPKDANLRYLVATVHLGLNQTHAAKQELYAVLRHDPSSADAHFLLGILEFETTPARAKQHLVEFLKLRPEGDKANEARELLEQADSEERAESVALTSRVTGDESTSPAVGSPVVNEEP